MKELHREKKRKAKIQFRNINTKGSVHNVNIQGLCLLCLFRIFLSSIYMHVLQRNLSEKTVQDSKTKIR